MNGLMMNWSLSSGVLLWFVTTLVQITLLAGLGLLASRCVPQYAVVRHSILMATLLLIVAAPISTWCFQRAGYGVIAITAPAPADFESSQSTAEMGHPDGVDSQRTGDSHRAPSTGSTDPLMSHLESNMPESETPENTMPEHSQHQVAEFADRDFATSPSQTALLAGWQRNRATLLMSIQDQSEAVASNQLWRVFISCIGVLWLAGCCVMAIRWLVAWRRLSRLIGRSKHVHVDAGDTAAAYLAACRLVECEPNATRIVISTAIATPVVAGIFKPTIVVPETFSRSISKQQLVEIFIHELAHIVRRDQTVLAAQQVARVFFWAHPLVERLCQRLTRASEEICDNYVLTQSATTAYSHTLLAVAELTAGRRNPLGTVGVVGGGWSLAERIAGLLDNRRERTTRLSGHSRTVVAIVAVCFSVVLLLTFRVTSGVAVAQAPVAQDKPLPADPKDGLRGAGDQLEFRLRGQVLSDDGTPLVNPMVSVRDISSTTDYPATVAGDSYEVWLPAKSFTSFSLALSVKCDDGRRGGRTIGSSELRRAISKGADIELQPNSRSIKVLVKHNDQPVADAKLKVLSTGYPRETIVRCDSRGEAIIGLNAGVTLLAFTAWTDSGMLGGYQFTQRPKRDSKASEHVIELIDCQERTVHVVDPDGSPVEGVRLMLQVATPPPRFNYFGNPTDCEVITDATGTAIYRWFPKLQGAHPYAELIDASEWLLQSQRNTEEAVEVVVAQPAARVRVEGNVSRGGQYVGGVLVTARSFQGEREDFSDIQFGIADHDGTFSFEALPNSTYCLFVLDEQWVSEPSIFTPVDPESGQRVSPHLTALDGHPVTIQLTSGTERKPIVGQAVSLRSELPYSWKENGKRQNGVTSREIYVTTDEHGLATALAPLGSLRANVSTAAWRSTSRIEVVAGKDNRVALHRAQEIAMGATGRLVAPPFSNIDLKKISISIVSLDGESGEDITPVVDGSGQFQFETKATAVGCFAYSDDGALAAVAFVDDLTQPFDMELLPAAYLSGQLLDGQGQPVADRLVAAEPRLRNPKEQSRTNGLFPRFMIGRTVETKTDTNGNYRLGPLPRLTNIRLTCDSQGSVSDGDREYLGEYYIELAEQRPPQVHRVGPGSSALKNLPPEQRLASLLRDARLGGYHAMVLLADYSDERCSEFVQENLLDYDANIKVSNYMQLRLDTGDSENGQAKAYSREQKWPLPPVGSVTAIALDANGKELGRADFRVAAVDANDNAAAFVETHLPPVVDARQKWDEAFALASETNRRVWVRISQRYCGPCHLLNRWLDDHREVLDKEFVILKIDDVRDTNGLEIAKEITRGKAHGIPFFAFYDADQQMLIDSSGPTGNIGFMSGYESKRHFRKMLHLVRHTLSDTEIEQLINSLDD